MKNKAAVTLITLAIALLASVVFPPTGRTAPSTNGRVLILDSTVLDGANSPEAVAAMANGKGVDVVDDATWMSMTAEQFAAYDALILGDPNCGSTPPAAAESNANVWGPVINGNIVVIATDATFHTFQGTPGAQQLVTSGVSFAVAAPNKTGAYITLSCYYQAFGPGTPVPMLDGLSTSGTFTVGHAYCSNDAHIVAVHPALSGLSDSDLSNWSCSIHEMFDSRPSDFTPLAIARDPEGGPPLPGSESFPDGSHGVPYILARGEGFPCTPPPSGLVSWWPI